MVVLRTTFCNKFIGPNSILNPAYRNQLIATLTVSINALSHGIGLGWTAPTLFKINSENSPIDFPISLDEVSWIGSLVSMGSIFGDVLQCCLVNFLGRKMCINIMTFPVVLAWILIYISKSIEYIYMSRFLIGLAGAACMSVLPIFIADISNKNVRGTLVSFYIVAISVGTLIGYILASSLNYYVFPLAAICVPCIFQILFIFLPETPQFKLKKGKTDEAWKSFQFYENYPHNEMSYEKKFDDLRATVDTKNPENKLAWRELLTLSALKSYITIFVICLLVHFSGLHSFISYMSKIFEISGTPFDPNVSTIIVGVVQILGNIAATLCIDQFGRKVLLIISSVGVASGLTAFGCYKWLTKLQTPAPYNFVPLVCMVFIIFLGNIGILCLPYVIIVEILPAKIRATALPVCLGIMSVVGFAALKLFPIFMSSFGISITMFLCATVTVLLLVYLVIFLPETKGKSIVSDQCDI